MNPKYIEDIDNAAKSLPFGELTITITRHRSTTPKVAYLKEATIAPKTNEEAFLDLQSLLNRLIYDKLDGKVEFALDFEKGTIRLITIKNKEVKKYGSR